MQLWILPLSVLYIGGESPLTIGCSIQLLFMLLQPFLVLLPFIIYLFCDVYSQSLLVLIAPYPLLPQRYSFSTVLVLYLLLQQLLCFLFLLYSLQVKGLLAYQFRYSTFLGGSYSLYAIQCLAYLLLHQVVLYCKYSLHSSCLYIYIYQQYCCFVLQYSAQCPFVGPCDFL